MIGTGNIGTDLMEKLCRSPLLELRAMVGIDPQSEGLARARPPRAGGHSREGVDWLLARAGEFRIVFEATWAGMIHGRHAPLLREAGLVAVDLTPAAVGPAVVPPVNLREHLGEPT